MISISKSEVVVLFDGEIAVGGTRRRGTCGDIEIQSFNLTLQTIGPRTDAKIGDPLNAPDLIGPEVHLAFVNTKSVDVLIRQLTELKKKMQGNPHELQKQSDSAPAPHK